MRSLIVPGRAGHQVNHGQRGEVGQRGGALNCRHNRYGDEHLAQLNRQVLGNKNETQKKNARQSMSVVVVIGRVMRRRGQWQTVGGYPDSGRVHQV